MEMIEVIAMTLDEALNVIESEYREGYEAADITLRKAESYLEDGFFIRKYHFLVRAKELPCKHEWGSTTEIECDGNIGVRKECNICGEVVYESFG